MKIYTKAGDAGQTGLIGGRKVSKADSIVCALGDLDELNSCLGLVAAHGKDAKLAEMLGRIQRAVFDIGAEVASPPADGERRPGRERLWAFSILRDDGLAGRGFDALGSADGTSLCGLFARL